MTASSLRRRSLRPHRYRRLILAAACILLMIEAGLAAAEYETVQILDNRRAQDMAMMDDNNVVVVYTQDVAGYQQIYSRMLWNHALQDPWLLDEQAPATVAPVLAACSRGFFLAYDSGTSILVRHGTGLTWDDPVTLGSGAGATLAARLEVDPRGTVHLLYSKSGGIWWSTNPPETGQWSAPQLAWPGVTGGRLGFKWLNGDWRPRIYAVNLQNMENLEYRQYDGTTWQPSVVLLEFSGQQYGDFRVAQRGDGRHFLALGYGWFTVRTLEENVQGAFLPAGDRVTDFGASCWEMMNFTPVNFDLASEPDGTIHLFRYQENWRWEDNDLWLCGYDLFWERSPADGGAWIESPPGFFADAYLAQDPIFVATPAVAGGPPAFCWYNGNSELRVSNYAATVPPPLAAGPVLFELSPNPTTGPTVIRWSGLGVRASRMSIYTVSGGRIRTLSLDRMGEVAWDGLDDSGRPVGSGICLVRVESDRGIVASRRLVVLR